jgi:hypothetical protein
MAEVAELRRVGLELYLVAEPKQRSTLAWTSFVEELATNSHLVAHLLGEHVPTPGGMCKVCTRGGRGTPYLRWPCSIWHMAEAARAVRHGSNEDRASSGRRATS